MRQYLFRSWYFWQLLLNSRCTSLLRENLFESSKFIIEILVQSARSIARWVQYSVDIIIEWIIRPTIDRLRTIFTLVNNVHAPERHTAHTEDFAQETRFAGSKRWLRIYLESSSRQISPRRMTPWKRILGVLLLLYEPNRCKKWLKIWSLGRNVFEPAAAVT